MLITAWTYIERLQLRTKIYALFTRLFWNFYQWLKVSSNRKQVRYAVWSVWSVWFGEFSIISIKAHTTYLPYRTGPTFMFFVVVFFFCCCCCCCCCCFVCFCFVFVFCCCCSYCCCFVCFFVLFCFVLFFFWGGPFVFFTGNKSFTTSVTKQPETHTLVYPIN